VALSIHFVVDNCPPERLDRGLLYMKRTKQRSCDIAAGAQLDRGMQFAERVRAEMPAIEILWRNLDPDDTGAHTKMSAAENYQRKVGKHLAWFQRNRLVYMPDNESGGSDEHIKTKYVPWLVDHLIMLHKDMLRGAVLRSSTGTFPENQYALFKPVFNAMLPGDYVSPNEYSAQPGYPKGSGGHIARYENFWIAAGRRLPTIIGEAGVAMNYDPGKGYIDAGMSDQAYAQQMLHEEVWYENGKIDRHLYLLGGFSHDGYRLRDGVFEYLENYYEKHPIVVNTPPAEPPATLPFVPIPAHIGTGEQFTIAIPIPLQAQPSTDPNCFVGRLIENEPVTVHRATHTTADGKTWFWIQRASTPVGESQYGWGAVALPPPDPIIVLPSTAEAALKHIAALWAERQQLSARRAEIDEELSALLSIWSDAA
jgi:hypothetical protein